MGPLSVQAVHTVQYAVLDNSTRLRVFNMLLCDAADGLRKATTCAGIPMRRMATPGPSCWQAPSVERSRIVSFFVSCQGFHSRVSPGAWARAGFPLGVPRLLLTRL